MCFSHLILGRHRLSEFLEIIYLYNWWLQNSWFVSNNVILIQLTYTEGACYTLNIMLGVIHVSQQPYEGICVDQQILTPFSWRKHGIFLFFFLPCHIACGILVHRPGMEPVPPAVEAWSPNLWTSREVFWSMLLCALPCFILKNL